MESKKILVSLTTLSEKNIKGDWKSKIKEINKYKLKEIALFLTVLEKPERKELYQLLERSTVESIPHVHLRTTMESNELRYLVDRFNTRCFNLHPVREYPLIHDYSEYNSKIYIENTRILPSDDELKYFGGICLDFAHWEDMRLEGKKEYCTELKSKAKKYKVGCSHVSAILEKPAVVSPHYSGIDQYDTHLLGEVNELDYIKRYKEYLPEFISLELENSIKDQLQAKKYLEKIINTQ